jgi:hypothetical protein
MKEQEFRAVGSQAETNREIKKGERISSLTNLYEYFKTNSDEIYFINETTGDQGHGKIILNSHGFDKCLCIVVTGTDREYRLGYVPNWYGDENGRSYRGDGPYANIAGLEIPEKADIPSFKIYKIEPEKAELE